ncbi:MAG: endo-1,4-beta-xylanase [Clostridia bacterium]|nr:endo-1,4-beta-xylanase [Clostridia bacterium]
MRKLTAAVLALVILMGAVAAMGEGNVTVYNSKFAESLDGWYARGSGSVSLAAPNNLHMAGRQSDWNSPGRDFAMVPGVTYGISAQVRQQQADSAHFMISVAHAANGAETYENLASGDAARDKWITLQCEYTAGQYDRFVLYVETTGAPNIEFDIRNFRVTAPEGTPSMATPTAMEILEAGEMPSLKEIYADRFDFGTCVPRGQAMDGVAMAFNRRQFSILTPENELKPDAVLDVTKSRKLAAEDESAAAVRFEAAKPLLDYAKKNGLKVHGHVLVWHSQTPEVFFHEVYDSARPLVTREVMLGRLENYIRGIMEYMDANYPGVIVSWDVVNEAIDDGSGWLRNSNWMKTVGEDFVARAFELARKYAPEGTLLFYNDYNTAMTGKQNGIVRLLKSLIPEGNIDGYGFQMHHSVDFPSIGDIERSVRRIAALGLKLRVSELDVGVPDNGEASFMKQAKMYAQIMKILDEHSDQFIAVQVWGVCDNQSWRSSSYPLLFDAKRNPKPAFWAVTQPDMFK